VLQATDRGGGSYQIVYTARAGPEEDGTVDAAVKSEIPAHLYDSVIVSAIVFTPHTDKLSDQGIRRCRSLSAHWGCAILLAPEPRVELPK
jgi:hypothetical protein